MHHSSLLNYFNVHSFGNEKIFGTFQKKAWHKWFAVKFHVNEDGTDTSWWSSELQIPRTTAPTQEGPDFYPQKMINVKTTKVDLQIQVYIDNIAML